MVKVDRATFHKLHEEGKLSYWSITQRQKGKRKRYFIVETDYNKYVKRK